jgi:hypothetical protein
LLSHDFRNQAIYIPGARQKVPMAAMIAEDEVARTEGASDSDAAPLLANAGVDGAEKFSGRKHLEQLLLHLSNEEGGGKVSSRE